jgi:hypothetical protein
MRYGLPESLPPELRKAAFAILKSAQEHGWQIGLVRMGDPSPKTVSFTGSSDSGEGFYFSCEQEDLIHRLNSLISHLNG